MTIFATERPAFSCAHTMTAGAAFTALSFEGARAGTFPRALWFSGHLLCFEHFLSSPMESAFRPRVYNGRLRGAVNI
jgi:hypothetical protein